MPLVLGNNDVAMRTWPYSMLRWSEDHCGALPPPPLWAPLAAAAPLRAPACAALPDPAPDCRCSALAGVAGAPPLGPCRGVASAAAPPLPSGGKRARASADSVCTVGAPAFAPPPAPQTASHRACGPGRGRGTGK